MRRDHATKHRPLAAAALAGALLVAVSRPAGAACTQLDLGAPGDQLGCSLALRDGNAFVGAKAGGYVRIYLPGSDPVERPPSRRPAGDEFGFAVAAADGWLAVGAPGEDGPRGADTGAVYLFRRDDGDWRPAGQLTSADASAGARFGSALALAGDTLLVGAPGDAERGSLAGAVYVFQLASQRQVQKLIAPGTRPFDSFGFAVAFDGERAAIGAPLHDGPHGTDSGAVSLWEGSGGSFRFILELAASDGAAGDQLGGALALAGGRLAAGARHHDAGGRSDAGSVYVFNLANLPWVEEVEEARLAGEGAGDEFGGAVALTSDRLLVGARLADTAGRDAGAAYLFARTRRDDGTFGWTRAARFDGGAGEGFGQAVALDGEDLLVSSLGGNQGRGAVQTCQPDTPAAEHGVDLALEQSVRGVPRAGRNLLYSVKVTNTGDEPATGVALDFPIPDGLDVTKVSGSVPALSTPGGLRFDLGRLAPRQSATTEIQLRLDCTCRPVVASQPRVSAREADRDASDNTSMLATPVDRLRELKVTFTHGTVKALPGQRVQIGGSIENLGCDAVRGARVAFAPQEELADLTDCSIEDSAAGALRAARGQVPGLSPGAKATFCLEGTLVEAGREVIDTLVEVAGPPGFTDDCPTDNAFLRHTPVGLDSGLRIYAKVRGEGKSQRAFAPGNLVTYTFYVHQGSREAAATVSMRFCLPPDLAFRSTSPYQIWRDGNGCLLWHEFMPAGSRATILVRAALSGQVQPGKQICAQADARLDPARDAAVAILSDDLARSGPPPDGSTCFIVGDP